MCVCGAGAYGDADALPGWISWITFLSPFRFALNSLMVNEFDGLLIYFDPLGVEVRMPRFAARDERPRAWN